MVPRLRLRLRPERQFVPFDELRHQPLPPPTMPDLDPQLALALKAAKKKPHNFVYILGSQDKILVVNKAKVSTGDLKEARERAGGGNVIKGVCRSDGADGLVFDTTSKTGGTLEKQLKASIKMQAGLVMQVSVAEKDAVDEVDDAPEQAKGPSSSPTKEGKVEGEAKPVAEVDPQLVAARASFKDAVMEATSLLKQLQVESPQEAAELAAKIKQADPGLAKPVATLTAKEVQAAVQTYKASLAALNQIRATAEEKLGKLRSGKTPDPTGAAKARVATLAKQLKDELAAALEKADEGSRKAIESKRAVVQTAVNEQNWEGAITAIEDLRAFLRQLSGAAPGERSAADTAVLQRARKTWRDDVYQRLEQVRGDAATADVRRVDTLRNKVEAAFQDDDMAAAGQALEALDTAIAAVAEATRVRQEHEKAVQQRRDRADILLGRLATTRDRANNEELKRVDSLRHPIAKAFELGDLAQIDGAIGALETALAEVDPAISARDKVLTDRLKLATDALDEAKTRGYTLAVGKLEEVGKVIPQYQKAGEWDKAEKAMNMFESKVNQLTTDLAAAMLLDDDIDEQVTGSAVEGGDFDLREIQRAFNLAMKGPIGEIAAELVKLTDRLTKYARKQANRASATIAVPPDASDVELDYSEGRPKLPGSGIFLSVEMQNNQTGSRGAEHVVPLDVLDLAAKKSRGKTAATDGGNPAFYYPVGPGKTCSKFLCIVIAGNTMITSYTITASAMMRKFGMNEDQFRTWAAKKAYTRTF